MKSCFEGAIASGPVQGKGSCPSGKTMSSDTAGAQATSPHSGNISNVVRSNISDNPKNYDNDLLVANTQGMNSAKITTREK